MLTCVKGESARGPFVGAAPSRCLRLYVWTSLRRDGMQLRQRSRSGMNSSTFQVVFRGRGCFHPCVSSAPGRPTGDERY